MSRDHLSAYLPRGSGQTSQANPQISFLWRALYCSCLEKWNWNEKKKKLRVLWYFDISRKKTTFLQERKYLPRQASSSCNTFLQAAHAAQVSSKRLPGPSSEPQPGELPAQPALPWKMNPIQHVSVKRFAYDKLAYSDGEASLQKTSK